MWLFACTTEDTTQSASTKDVGNSLKKKNNSENNHVRNNFELASNGLEYKVVKKYEMDYFNGNISSVVNGNVYKMDSAKNRIFLGHIEHTPRKFP